MTGLAVAILLGRCGVQRSQVLQNDLRFLFIGLSDEALVGFGHYSIDNFLHFISTTTGERMLLQAQEKSRKRKAWNWLHLYAESNQGNCDQRYQHIQSSPNSMNFNASWHKSIRRLSKFLHPNSPWHNVPFPFPSAV